MKIVHTLTLIGACTLAVPALAAGSAPDGKQLYTNKCAMCHGQNGKPAMPGAADLSDPKGVLTKPDAALTKHILNGIGNMPAFKGDLDKTQIQAILDYARQAFGVKAPH